MSSQATASTDPAEVSAELERLRPDAAGVVHPRASSSARIASLVPSLTELLIDLGLGEQIVARTRFCIHPAPAVESIPAVGGTKKVHLERLKSLAPTHAFVNIDENTKEMADALATFVPHIVVTHPVIPDDNRNLYALCAQVFDCKEQAAKLYTAYNHAKLAILGAFPPRNVVYLIWKNPWMTVSRDTYVSALLGLVNWHTLCHDDAVRYPTIEVTPKLIEQTDLFLFSSEPYSFGSRDLDDFAHEFDCPREKLRLIDGEYCSWYGSRAIAGLRYLGDLARRESAHPGAL